MGFASSVLTDFQSSHYNPGTLVLGDWDHAVVAAFPLASHPFGYELYRFRSFGGSVKFTGVSVPVARKIDIAGSYQYLRFRGGPFYEMSQYGSDIRREYTWRDDVHDVTISAAYRSSLDLGVGVTYRRVSSDTYGMSADGYSFSAGVLARVHLIDMPSSRRRGSGNGIRLAVLAGLSLNDLGPDMKLHWGGPAEPGLEQPKNLRTGLGFHFSYETCGRTWVELLPVYEQEIDLSDELHEKTNKYGVEAGCCELLFLRAGIVDLPNWNLNLSTCGASLSSRGLRRTPCNSRTGEGSVSSRERRSLWTNLDVVLSFTTVSPDGLLREYRTDSWSITVTL